MKKEEDLISILLKETYGHVSQESHSNAVSLGEYFQKKQSGLSGFSPCTVEIYSEIVRININGLSLDIPFGLGIIERSLFKSAKDIELQPISDFTWMKILRAQFTKNISWVAYSSFENKVFFLTRQEAEGLNFIKGETQKAA